jgi:hypothetical protein
MVKEAMATSLVYNFSPGTSNLYVADVFGYGSFPPIHLLGSLTEAVNSRLTGYSWEATVYLGLTNLVILTWLCLFAKQKDSGLLIYVLSGMVVFCVLASGDSLHILGKGTIPMPDVLLSKIPFFRNVRTPSRAIVFVYLFLAIAMGHAASLSWQHRHRSAVRWGSIVVAALMVLDFYPFHVAITPVSCPPGLTLIRDDPERNFGILNLPGGYEEGNAYMLQQMCHGRPIVQGETSRNLVVTLRDHLEVENLEAQRRQLAAARVKYIVISPRTEWLFRWRKIDGQKADYFQTYPIVYSSSNLTILRVY